MEPLRTFTMQGNLRTLNGISPVYGDLKFIGDKYTTTTSDQSQFKVEMTVKEINDPSKCIAVKL
jgi:hypothetical protein